MTIKEEHRLLLQVTDVYDHVPDFEEGKETLLDELPNECEAEMERICDTYQGWDRDKVVEDILDYYFNV